MNGRGAKLLYHCLSVGSCTRCSGLYVVNMHSVYTRSNFIKVDLFRVLTEWDVTVGPFARHQRRYKNAVHVTHIIHAIQRACMPFYAYVGTWQNLSKYNFVMGGSEECRNVY